MLNKEFWSSLRRYPRAGLLGGVCAGLAHRFDWNLRLVRLLVLVTFFVVGGFPMLLAYAALWYLLDAEPGLPGAAGAGGDCCGGPGAPSPQELRTRFIRMESRLRNMEACVSSRDYELRRELRKLES